MNGCGILTLGDPLRALDRRFLNDVAEIEGRLRFEYAGWGLAPTFGGDPLHPDERVATSLAIARQHVHHLVDARVIVLVVLLAGAPEPNLVASAVRYFDLRMRPPVPVLLLCPEEHGIATAAPLLLASAELRAIGRTFHAASCRILEDDPRFVAFSERVEAMVIEGRAVARDASFQDDLRRHHHLRVCPTGAAPLASRIPDAMALRTMGITTSVLGAPELEARARRILGGSRASDPRLAAALAADARRAPGAMSTLAAALAIRDVADERLAQSVAIGGPLPANADATAIAAILNALRAPDGGVESPIYAADRDDDAGALTQHILTRATITATSQRFRDAAQSRPGAVAITLPIVDVADRRLVLGIEGAWKECAAVRDLASERVTCARIGFFPAGAQAAALESDGAPVRMSDAIEIPLQCGREGFLAAWPGERAAIVRGAAAKRFAGICSVSGIAVTPPIAPPRRAEPRTSPPAPPPSEP